MTSKSGVPAELIRPGLAARSSRHRNALEEMKHRSLDVVEHLERFSKTIGSQAEGPSADVTRTIETCCRIIVRGVIQGAGHRIVLAGVSHERFEKLPPLLARSQGPVHEQVGDHCKGRWLPTDGGCSSNRCRDVHELSSSAGHTSCDHAELPGEYL